MKNYKAFISYKHITSTGFAENLELAIKRYAKPPWQLPATIFRDEKYLQASASLTKEIKAALEASEYLIYLASPEAAKSEWVVDELDQWCAKPERVRSLIIVLTDGAIEIDKKSKRIDWEKSNALPRTRTLEKQLTADPLFIDLSWAITDKQQSLLDPDYKKAINQIVATMRGLKPIEMSDIAIREYRKGVRFKNGFISAVLTLSLGLAVATWFAFDQKDVAEVKSRQSAAHRLAAEAELAIKQQGSLLDRAIQMSLESIRLAPSSQGNAALRHSLSLLPTQIWQQRYAGPRSKVLFSPNGKILATIGQSKQTPSSHSRKHVVDIIEVPSRKALGRLLNDAEITAIAFDATGQKIATAGEDGISRIWDLSTRKEIARFDNGKEVFALAFSPNGQLLATGGLFSGIAVWSVESGTIKYQLPAVESFDPTKARMVRYRGDWVYIMPKPKAFSVILFSNDGALLVATGGYIKRSEPNLYVWEVATGKRILKANHFDQVRKEPLNSSHRTVSDDASTQNHINDIVFGPDNETLATAGFDGSVRLWSLRTGKLLGYMLHDDSVNSLGFSPTGKQLVSASSDNTARVWEVGSGRELHRLSHDATVVYAEFSATGERVATASHDKTVRLWNSEKAEEVARVTHAGVVTSLDINPSGRFLATGDQNGSVALWDLESLKEINQVSEGTKQITSTPDLRYFATIDDAKSASVWQSSNGRLIARIPHSEHISDIAISVDGDFLATRSNEEESKVRVWQISGNKLITTIPAAKAVGRGMALSRKGRFLAITNGSGQTRLWEIETNTLVHTFEHEGRSLRHAFSPNNRYLATITVSPGHKAHLWDIATGKPIAVLNHDASVYALAFSPDGKFFATGSDDNTAKVWSLPSDKPYLSILHDEAVRSVKFSQDGELIASGSDDATAQVWDIKSRKPLRRVKQADEIRAVALDPTSQFLATASTDHTTRVWRISDGSEETRITHSSRGVNVLFNADGRHLISETSDRKVLRWLWSNRSLLEIACTKKIRDQDFNIWATNIENCQEIAR